ncbi:tetratricopeptide repeat protein [Actinoplanes sp. NPDC024001]|uniref:AfsR/SARP family transcriptional regulator n=1 Tax=Actinoplanes sp. NPDC024001 TaxID=3154598 RepID=UPI0033E8A2DE
MASSPSVSLTVLGPVRGWRGEAEIPFRPPQARAVLAVLLTRVGRPVTLAELVDVVWGPSAPNTAANAVHGYVSTLRKLLEPGLPARDPGRWLIRGSGGYQFDDSAGRVDLVEFRRLVARARAPRDATDMVDSYQRALRLWTGPIAGNIDPAVRSHAAFQEIDRECRQAARDAADAALAAGQAAALLDAIHTIAEWDVLDESMQARLILLLKAAGRQAQALDRYDLVRRTLADELGVDPGAELSAAHREALRPAGVARPGPAPSPIRPAQLPADLPLFTGRTTDLAQAKSVTSGGFAAWPLLTVAGMAGVGKTTLAVHLAHEVADRFPDGQLFVNLRGFDPGGAVTDPADALRGFLEAFGVTAANVPRTMDAMVTLYRSLLADRRVLVLLDNARDAEQVRPLLPGSRGCLAIVTSRTALSGLVVTHGARPLTLGALTAAEASDLLASRLGADRVAAEPAAVEQIIRCCGGLPLALAVVAARAATDPDRSFTDIAAALAAAHGRLDAFAGDEAATDVRAVFSWSYRALSDEAARLFRLVGAVRVGPDVGLSAVARLAGTDVQRVRPLLAELVRTNLLGRSAAERYTTHDLLAAFASETADATDTPGDRRAALQRLLDHYRRTALAAHGVYLPNRAVPAAGPVPAPGPDDPADRDAAVSWFTTERSTLLQAVRAAADNGFPTHAWQIMWSATPFLHRSGHWDDRLTGSRIALAAAESTGDPAATAAIRMDLGLVATELGLHDEADEQLLRAVELFAAAGDHTSQAEAYRRLSYLRELQDRYADALGYVTEALRLQEATGNRPDVARSLNHAAWIHVLDREPALAIDKGERALAIFQDIGHVNGQASTWDTLGHAHHKLGDYPRARECYLASLRLRREEGTRVYEADVLHRLGDNHHAAGEPAEAHAHWRQALVIMSEIGHPGTDEVRTKLTAG